MSRIIPNKLVQVRAEIEGRAYRMISFFHQHPSEIPEEGWTVMTHEGSKFIVDKVSLSVMAECRCELLTRETDTDSDEPSIVSVEVNIIQTSDPVTTDTSDLEIVTKDISDLEIVTKDIGAFQTIVTQDTSDPEIVEVMEEIVTKIDVSVK